jgi:hypothetical protein
MGLLTVWTFVPAAFVAPALAADRPTVMVVGEDADPDSVARDNRIFKRVIEAISTEIDAAGFKVYDETAASPEGFTPGRIRRSDAELIDLARRMTQPPIDVIALFTIYATAEDKTYTQVVRARVASRLIDLRSGRSLGGFEAASDPGRPAPVDCPRACVLEIAGDLARGLGRDVGAALGEKLAGLVPAAPRAPDLTGSYVLSFKGFAPDEMADFDSYLVAFDGYRAHRMVQGASRAAEYWYESSIAPDRLDRNLRVAVDRVGVKARISVAGRNIAIEKIVQPSPP